MKRISLYSFVCTAVCALALMLPAGSAAAEAVPPTLTISGTGVARIAPDTAAITVGVVTDAKDAAQAHADNAAATARVHSALHALGIADRDIQTVHYDFSPRYDMRDGRDGIIGYTVQNSVVITVRDLSSIGKVIDKALTSGANRIDSLEFTASDTLDAKNAAIADAVRAAKSKAQAIANALGVRLVRIENVYAETQSDSPRSANFMPMMMAKEASAASTPIAAGELSVEATVNITYVIE